MPATLEVAGKDIGPDVNGLTDNFALEGLTLGDPNNSNLVKVQLIDTYDNQDDGQTECIYVENLAMHTGATLDLNGLTLYYLNDESPDAYLADGGVFDSAGGGALVQIPEPATLALLTLDALGAPLRR